MGANASASAETADSVVNMTSTPDPRLLSSAETREASTSDLARSRTDLFQIEERQAQGTSQKDIFIRAK